MLTKIWGNPLIGNRNDKPMGARVQPFYTHLIWVFQGIIGKQKHTCNGMQSSWRATPLSLTRLTALTGEKPCMVACSEVENTCWYIAHSHWPVDSMRGVGEVVIDLSCSVDLNDSSPPHALLSDSSASVGFSPTSHSLPRAHWLPLHIKSKPLRPPILHLLVDVVLNLIRHWLRSLSCSFFHQTETERIAIESLALLRLHCSFHRSPQCPQQNAQWRVNAKFEMQMAPLSVTLNLILGLKTKTNQYICKFIQIHIHRHTVSSEWAGSTCNMQPW